MMGGLVWVLRQAVEERVIIERDVGFRELLGNSRGSLWRLSIIKLFESSYTSTKPKKSEIGPSKIAKHG